MELLSGSRFLTDILKMVLRLVRTLHVKSEWYIRWLGGLDWTHENNCRALMTKIKPYIEPGCDKTGVFNEAISRLRNVITGDRPSESG